MTELITDKPSKRPVEEGGVLAWINREAAKALTACIERINSIITADEVIAEADGATIDWSASRTATFSLTANRVLTFTAPDTEAAFLRLVITQSGAFTITWPADVEWTNGPPALTGARNLVLLVYVDGEGYTGL